MFKFECKDMGMDCDFVATANTMQETLDAAMAHAVEAHGEMLQGMSAEDAAGMNAKLIEAIQEVNPEESVDEEQAVDAEESEDDDAVAGEDETEGDEEGDEEVEDGEEQESTEAAQ